MLQLRQHLEGDALKVIQGFSASTLGYASARKRLDEKFGGNRRTVLLHLDSIRQMRPVNFSDLKILEEFSDRLELSIIALQDAGRTAEFEDNSMFYSVAKSKLSPMNIAHFKRWASLEKKTENLVNLQTWLALEVRFRVEAQEEYEGLYGSSKQALSPSDRKQGHNYATNNLSVDKCNLCNSANHKLADCREFQSYDVSKRWQFAKDKSLCFRCLGLSHRGRFCKNSRRCNVEGCPRSHHILLHGGGYQDQREVPVKRPVMMHSNLNTAPRDLVAMRIIPIIVDSGHRRLQLNALLDECSTDSYITQSVASELGLHGPESSWNVLVLGGSCELLRSNKVNLNIASLDGQTRINLDAFTVGNLTGDLQIVDWSKHASNWPHLVGIDFPKVGRRVYVDILLGLNVSLVHRSLTELIGRPGEPIARLTPLGWTCIGPISNIIPNNGSNHFARTFFVKDETNTLLRNMWELETSGVRTDQHNLSPVDRGILSQTESSLSFNGERYTISIPWKKGEPSLSDNFEMASGRLRNLEKSLAHRPEVATDYNRIILEHEQKGYIREVLPSDVSDSNVWYIPHFPVVRLDKATTKVRLVLDAAAKFNGKSLNDCIHAGPKLQRDLIDILIRFRSKPIAVAADITEMFLQIELNPKDRPYHRFLWRKADPCQPIKIYEYQRLVFGNASSPYLSQFVIREHAQSNLEHFPLGAKSILDSMYVDDLLDSVDSVQEANTLRQEVTKLLCIGGFHIRKWASNSLDVLTEVPVADRIGSIEINDKSGLPSLKTLGIHWEPEVDSFTFVLEPPEDNFNLTKRTVLSKTAKLFDPLGLLSPFTVRAKIGIQETWVRGLDWDETLPLDLYENWNSWFAELPLLKDIYVSRCLVKKIVNIVNRTLHAFVDASEVAYAAAVYLRGEYNDGTFTTNLIASKTRVAPLKAISIPKLELCGAVLGLRLAKSISNVLDISTSCITYWTDSQNVLFWIKGESRKYKPFVSNRIGEIHCLSEPLQWKYVPTAQNASDLATRGLSATALAQSALWWNGPNFLGEVSDYWPKSVCLDPSNDSFLEIRSKPQRAFLAKLTYDLGRLHAARYSSWIRLVRVTCWLFRFIYNCRNRNHSISKVLTVDEISNSEQFWFRVAQNDDFQNELRLLKTEHKLGNKSPLISLNPFLDEHNVLRVNGRLRQAENLSYDTRFPVILPKDHDVSRLIVTHLHTQGNHALGTSHTLSILREKFWLLRARSAIKSVQHNCRECKRRKCKAAQQVMAPLPLVRLGNPLRAFAKVGVDFAGPFTTKQGRGKLRTKRYLCLFTCLASRAVHLEMAWGLDTHSFLLAFDRFVNRRGRPILVLSDNGTNFVGAHNELKDIYKLDNSVIGDTLANKSIQWQFNPPLAPHFGGVFEALIKSAKRAIKAILCEADINDEELLTAFIHAESILNSRPLCYQGDDHNDAPVLTPNHFLYGQVGEQLVPPNLIDNVRFNPRNRWRRIHDLVNQFWKRWLKEFLPSLNSRSKWHTPYKDLNIGDIVVVIDPLSPRGKWPLGRILQTYPGKDNRVRVVDIKVGDHVFKRPINRLCPLEA